MATPAGAFLPGIGAGALLAPPLEADLAPLAVVVRRDTQPFLGTVDLRPAPLLTIRIRDLQIAGAGDHRYCKQDKQGSKHGFVSSVTLDYEW
jgi:hypothetical protein